MTENLFPEKTKIGLPFREYQQNAQYYNLNICKTGDPAILETVQSKSKTFYKEKKDNDIIGENYGRKSWNTRNNSWCTNDSLQFLPSSYVTIANHSNKLSKTALEEDKHGSTFLLNVAACKRDIFVDKNTASTPPSNAFVECLVFDFHYQNDPQLGHQTEVAWNIQIITKGLGKPENGNIPLRTLQARIYKLYESDQQNANTARSLLQDTADEKGIEIGNVMNVTELSNLFEFAADKSSCLIIEPPLQWYETITSAIINNIQECPKLTLVTKNANGVPRFKEIFTKIVAQQWQKQAEKFGTPATKRGKKRKRQSVSIPPPPNSPPLPSSPVSTHQ